ncbi:hypothetical protein EYV94_27345 [Puteibacter caeruleilacunae]|nr:hypothetical protein EYV94_27345 [Puteibacter caeruleilacunae]
MRLIYSSFILFIMLLSSSVVNAQKLVPLFQVKGSYTEDGYLIIPKLHLKSDNSARLFHNDKLCFEPKGEYELCTYEVFKNKFVIVTPINESKKYNSAIFAYPKRNIKIYSLNSNKIYDVNISNGDIKRISEQRREITVLMTDGESVRITME